MTVTHQDNATTGSPQSVKCNNANDYYEKTNNEDYPQFIKSKVATLNQTLLHKSRTLARPALSTAKDGQVVSMGEINNKRRRGTNFSNLKVTTADESQHLNNDLTSGQSSYMVSPVEAPASRSQIRAEKTIASDSGVNKVVPKLS